MSGSLLYVSDNFGAVTWYRCQVPGSELERLGYTVGLASPQDPKTPLGVRTADVVVVERPSDPRSAHLVDHALHLGKLVVCDLDDDLWCVDPSNPAHAFWSQRGPQAVLEHCLRAAHVATVSTPALAKVVGQLNKNVHVLPNVLPDGLWASTHQDRRSGAAVRVGWSGSQHHLMDLKLLRGVAAKFLAVHPAATLEIAGTREVPFPVHQRVIWRDTVPMEDYPALVSSFDIGIAPLADTRFNRAKSDLKLLEYAACGLPAVASRVEPYRRSLVHGETGFLAQSAADWLKYLSMLARDERARRDMGREARLFAEKRMVSKNLDRWLAAYRFA